MKPEEDEEQEGENKEGKLEEAEQKVAFDAGPGRGAVQAQGKVVAMWGLRSGERGRVLGMWGTGRGG